MKGRGWLLVGRWALRVALVIWLGFGLWNALHNIGDLSALRDRGRTAQAQVIGREIVPPQASVGYVHYAFKVERFAVENRFPVPRAAYPEYPTGRAFTVTYLPEHPHTHQMGLVDGARVLRSEVMAVLLGILGVLALGLPLLAIEAALHTRRPGSTPRG
ncbi:MAG TPA: DUF3592 domain-containing protein [Chthonomonadaceae bacterium]|nr:DUF3592 domain-containing protein [Chthonomonadaceae bacterium]